MFNFERPYSMLRIDDIHAYGVIGTRGIENLFNILLTYGIIQSRLVITTAQILPPYAVRQYGGYCGSP